MATAFQLSAIKDIFKKDARTSWMLMSFCEQGPGLEVKGGDRRTTYEISRERLMKFGTYLDKSNNFAQNYQILVPLKHILGTLKIVEMIDGNFKSAMELTSHDSACCFLFTETDNFMFMMGLSSIRFENSNP